MFTLTNIEKKIKGKYIYYVNVEPTFYTHIVVKKLLIRLDTIVCVRQTNNLSLIEPVEVRQLTYMGGNFKIPLNNKNPLAYQISTCEMISTQKQEIARFIRQQCQYNKIQIQPINHKIQQALQQLKQL